MKFGTDQGSTLPLPTDKTSESRGMPHPDPCPAPSRQTHVSTDVSNAFYLNAVMTSRHVERPLDISKSESWLDLASAEGLLEEIPHNEKEWECI